jgi:peptidoglycan hydrolase-like protein with peptidoglycan-binding domain
MELLRRDIQDQIGRIAKPAPTPRPPVPVGEYADILLFRGSEGPAVAELQRRLNEHGEKLNVDGIFGPNTEAAVRAFQRRTRGLKVDGIVGPMTAAALRLNLGL